MPNHLKKCEGKKEGNGTSTNRKSSSRGKSETTEKMESTLISVFDENPDRQVTTGDLVKALQDAGFSHYNAPTLRHRVNDLMKRIKGQMRVRRVKRGVYRRIADRSPARQPTEPHSYESVIDETTETTETTEMIRLERDMLRQEVQKLKEMLMRAIM